MISPTASPLPQAAGAGGAPSAPLRIKMFFPNHLTPEWQGHIVFGITQHFFNHGVDLDVWVSSANPAARRPYVHEGAPGLLHRVLYKFNQAPMVERLAERRFLDSLREGDIVYAWPTTSYRLLERIKERGHTILIEAINCAQATYARILDEAYGRLGGRRPASPLDQADAEGRSPFSLADRVFTAHRLSTQSYVEAGVPEDRIFESSYGWNPERFRGTGRALAPIDGLTVLFMGTPIVRKGVHILLEAWERAGIKGRLVIVGGKPEPLISERYARFFERPDVLCLGWSGNVGDFYRSADVFAFPSFEEGGPLVTYEAMGCGVPALVSPMGGGAIGWENEGSITLDPFDVDAWAAALRRLADDPEHRRELGEQARRAALRFTWDDVGRKRLAQIAAMPRAGEEKQKTLV